MAVRLWDWLERSGVRILGWFGLSATTARQLIRFTKAAMFFAVNTVGLRLNMMIAWLLERAGVHYLLISLTVLIVVPMFNFAGHRLITFARSG